MTRGSMVSICRLRYGVQAFISAGSGSRLSGGLHLMMFAMNTSSLRMGIDAMSSSSSFPALPTNGRPDKSSSLPGPSPMNITSASAEPSPGTVLVLVFDSWQSWHPAICAFRFCKVADAEFVVSDDSEVI